MKFNLVQYLLVSALLALVGTMAHASDSSLYFYYHGQQHAFNLDQSRVAIKLAAFHGSSTLNTAADLQTAGSSLGSIGLDASELSPFSFQGWIFGNSQKLVNKAPKSPGTSAHDWIKSLIGPVAVNSAVDFVSPVFTDKAGKPLVMTASINLAFKPSVSAARQREILASIPAIVKVTQRKLRNATHINLLTSFHNGVDVIDAANALAILPEVRYAEPNFMITAHAAVSFSGYYYNNDWAIHNTGGYSSPISPSGTSGFDLEVFTPWYSYSILGAGVTVEVLDCGVQMDNPYLQSVSGDDFTGQTLIGSPGAPNSSLDTHGTTVASVIAGMDSSGAALGAAPESSIFSARVFETTNSPDEGDGTLDSDWVTAALDEGYEDGFQITSTSLEFGSESDEVEEAFADTSSLNVIAAVTNPYSGSNTPGMLHFAAAGNDSASTLPYPAAYANVNAVGAVDDTGSLADFSNTAGSGQSLAYVGPGVDVLIAERSDDGFTSPYLYIGSGTSYASPYCAAVAALLLQQNPSWTPAAVISWMNQTATNLGSGTPNSSYGYGMPNADTAFTSEYFQLYNVSCRSENYTGDNVIIMGFNIGGSGTKTFLLRADGPALYTLFDLPGTLSDPVITLYNSSSEEIATNTGWSNASNASDIATAAGAVGAFPLADDSGDSAILTSLSPGGYTIIVTSASSSDGIALAEVYDASPTAANAQVVNLSSRSFVPEGSSSGNQQAIAGFVIQGNVPKQVLIRADGPALYNTFSLTPYLANPTLTIYNSSSTAIATNTVWGTASGSIGTPSTIAAAASVVGAYSWLSGSNDSAVLMTLDPGLYSAVVDDANGSDSGIVSIEVYQVP